MTFGPWSSNAETHGTLAYLTQWSILPDAGANAKNAITALDAVNREYFG
jgi:hypothetical protein